MNNRILSIALILIGTLAILIGASEAAVQIPPVVVNAPANMGEDLYIMESDSLVRRCQKITCYKRRIRKEK